MAAFTYGHVALSLVVSFAVTRYVIAQVGGGLYGAWLATAAFFGYAAMADLGVFAIYPWLVADADGRKDAGRLRALIGQGPWMGLTVAGLYALVVGVLWVLYPSFVKLAGDLRAAALAPALVFVALTAAAYPLKWAVGAVYGLQDAAWTGASNVLQPLFQLVVIGGLTFAGFGLFGLAVGTAGAPLVACLVTGARLRASRPELFKLDRAPDRRTLRELFREGSGAWISSTGWLLAMTSDLVVLAFLELSPAVAGYALTSRLARTLMNLSWALPDSANVGLAHLNAEGKPERVRSVVATLGLANLLLIGGASCLVLCVNATFVPLWVKDPGLYAGDAMTLLFVAEVVVLSAGHALLVPLGVLGHRHAVGWLQMGASVLQVGLAVGLGRLAGPVGVASAGALATAAVVLPVGSALIARHLGRECLAALGKVALRWLPRWLPVAAACWWAGRALVPHAGWPGVVAGGALAGVVYLLALRPLFRELPWGGKMGGLLRRLRVI